MLPLFWRRGTRLRFRAAGPVPREFLVFWKTFQRCRLEAKLRSSNIFLDLIVHLPHNNQAQKRQQRHFCISEAKSTAAGSESQRKLAQSNGKFPCRWDATKRGAEALRSVGALEEMCDWRLGVGCGKWCGASSSSSASSHSSCCRFVVKVVPLPRLTLKFYICLSSWWDDLTFFSRGFQKQGQRWLHLMYGKHKGKGNKGEHYKVQLNQQFDHEKCRIEFLLNMLALGLKFFDVCLFFFLDSQTEQRMGGLRISYDYDHLEFGGYRVPLVSLMSIWSHVQEMWVTSP